MVAPAELCQIDHWTNRGSQQLPLFHEAERLFTKAIELKPESVQICENFSHFYLLWGKIEEAKKMLEKAKELDQVSVGALYNNLAGYFAIWGIHLDEALEAAEQATQLSPNISTFFDTLGFVRYRRGEFEQAEEAYKRCMELAEREDEVDWFHLGKTYERQNRLEAAIGAYEKALQLKPDYLNASNALQQLRR